MSQTPPLHSPRVRARVRDTELTVGIPTGGDVPWGEGTTADKPILVQVPSSEVHDNKVTLDFYIPPVTGGTPPYTINIYSMCLSLVLLWG